MLPHMHHHPAQLVKLFVFLPVPGNVSLKLLPPPLPLFFGRMPWSGQACQKQPSTKTAIRAEVNARSGRPGSNGKFTLNRRPRRCSSRRMSISGAVEDRRIFCICAETAALRGLRWPSPPTLPLGSTGPHHRRLILLSAEPCVTCSGCRRSEVVLVPKPRHKAYSVSCWYLSPACRRSCPRAGKKAVLIADRAVPLTETTFE